MKKETNLELQFSDEIQVISPKNANESLENIDENQIRLKDKLMELVIQTKDEEIKLNISGDEYKKIGIHDEWRQFNAEKSTYFSYQEKAVKDFIYRFTNNGILSDQVGMGKTIEAGMILSELAYKKQLGSLLVIVPNEKMAEKWESELAKKFGFRNYFKDLIFLNGKEEERISNQVLPKVYVIRKVDDLYTLFFDADDRLTNREKTLDLEILRQSKNIYSSFFNPNKITEIKKEISEMMKNDIQIDSKEFKINFLRNIYLPHLKGYFISLVKEMKVDNFLDLNDYELDFKRQIYYTVDMYLDTPFSDGLITNAIYKRLFDAELIQNLILKEFDFLKINLGKKILTSLNEQSRDANTETQRKNYVNKINDIAQKIKEVYPILIVSKTVSNLVDGKLNSKFNLLNMVLNDAYESESLKYISTSQISSKGYRVIDLLISMSYRTLIVDEAHDFIKISHKKSMSDEIKRIKDYKKRQVEGKEFSDIDLSSSNKDSLKYNVFPLYNDYYFLRKDSLFVELKALAERSYRKIFMTATPIKADMVDFYLLFLLTDNNQQFSSIRNRKLISSQNVRKISKLLLENISDNHKKALNYKTNEDIVYGYIYSYYLENQNKMKGFFIDKINYSVNMILEEGKIDLNILKSLSFNRVRKQFQDLFTFKDVNNNDVEIHTISDLVSSNKGIEQWQNVYSQIGIRSTRHQTFKLDDHNLDKIKPNFREKYKNLPLWSRRNGTIIYTYKRDHFFDQVIRSKLEEKRNERVKNYIEEDISENFITKPRNQELNALKDKLIVDIQNVKNESLSEILEFQKIKKLNENHDLEVDNLEQKYKPKETAIEIYNYIDKNLSGKLEIADYFSRAIDYVEFRLHMVSAMMTNGLKLTNSDEPKRINGKILLFCDMETQSKVINWFKKESSNENNMTKDDLDVYVSNFKHEPIWYFNQNKINQKDRWVITTDIKALNDKLANYLIIVEPDKYEEGVDLQSSNTLINFDIKFDPLKMEQRIGRIDRVKLVSKQPQLEIISFTPLNDLSGFMVDFLAYELEMFSRWKGDTTGIVTFPLGDSPNSATFESAMLAINDAYKFLYNLNSNKFFEAFKIVLDLHKLYYKNSEDKVKKFINKESEIISDFEFLKNSENFVDIIISNIDNYGNEDKTDYISFGEVFKTAILDKALEEKKISFESTNNHTNDLLKVKNAIENYYKINIGYFENLLDNLDKIRKNSLNNKEIQESNYTSDYKQQLTNFLIEFKTELVAYENSDFKKVDNNSLAVKKDDLYDVIDPILNRYRNKVEHYLSQIVEIFDYFCKGVKDKSVLMSKFISYLTIEEFKVVADNHE